MDYLVVEQNIVIMERNIVVSEEKHVIINWNGIL